MKRLQQYKLCCQKVYPWVLYSDKQHSSKTEEIWVITSQWRSSTVNDAWLVIFKILFFFSLSLSGLVQMFRSKLDSDAGQTVMRPKVSAGLSPPYGAATLGRNTPSRVTRKTRSPAFSKNWNVAKYCALQVNYPMQPLGRVRLICAVSKWFLWDRRKKQKYRSLMGWVRKGQKYSTQFVLSWFV